MTRYAALIPIKYHSERVPGKNFRMLEGKPLWRHIVETLHGIDRIERLYIDTDSARFTSEVLADFPKLTIIERPEELRGDFVSTNKLFAYDLSQIHDEIECFVQTHTTNPLLTADTIEKALDTFEAARSKGEADSLFTVTAYYARFYRPDLSPVNHDPKELIRTQDLEPMLEENSNLYLFTRDSFAKTNARIGAKPCLYAMDRLEATDIDDQETWMLAEALLKQRQGV